MTYNCRYCGRKTRRSPVFVPGARVSTAGRAWEWAVLALCLCGACPVPRRRLRHRSTIAVRPFGKPRHPALTTLATCS